MNAVILFALLATAQSEKTWQAGPPAFKPKAEKFAPSVKIDKDVITLRNRGIIVTKDDVYTKEGGKTVTLTLAWKWTEGDTEKKPPYPDHLVVGLRTSGKQREKWSHDLADGLIVRFIPVADRIDIQEAKGGDDPITLASTQASKPFTKGMSHDMKIVDTGDDLEVYIGGDAKYALKVPVKGKGEGRKIAIANREPVAAIVKESIVTKVIVTVKGR